MNKRVQKGFTLVEIAISFLIIALLLGGALMTLGAQNDVRATAETQRTLQQAKEALLAFAIANGRLPCPALGPTTGLVQPEDLGTETLNVVGTNCKTDGDPLKMNESFFPARALGIGPTDESGFLVDAWGTPIRYYVTRFSPPGYDGLYTSSSPNKQLRDYVSNSSDGYKNAAQATPPGIGLKTHLTVCSEFVVGSANPPKCSKTLSDNAIAILISRGRHSTDESSDEGENLNGGVDHVFISHTPDPNFDDIVTWLSPYTLYNRMIAAGAL